MIIGVLLWGEQVGNDGTRYNGVRMCWIRRPYSLVSLDEEHLEALAKYSEEMKRREHKGKGGLG